MIEKARIFIYDAGKVIMVISLLLWGLSHFGPPGEKWRLSKEQYTEMTKARRIRQQS